MRAGDQSQDREYSRPRPTDRQVAMRQIDSELVQHLATRLECRKPDHVMAKLGISLNTWDKLLTGSPIRASVASRLVDRFSDHINI